MPGARIAQISRSGGGVPKRAIASIPVTALGLDGDVQRNRKLHGGPERALCLFSLERIPALQAEGHPIQPGSIGEYLTLEGLDWSRVAPSTSLRLDAEVVIQITAYTAPCANITGSFRDGDYTLVSQCLHPGNSRVYARVLCDGELAAGDHAQILSTAEAAVPIEAR